MGGIYEVRRRKTGSGIQKLMGGGGGYTQTNKTAWISHKPTFIFFQDKGSSLKTKSTYTKKLPRNGPFSLAKAC
jgi:hypothetical protein